MDTNELVHQLMNWVAQQLPLLPGSAVTETASGVAKAFGGDIWSKVKSLFAKSGRSAIPAALETSPAQPEEQGTFRCALHELLEQNPAYADELRQLLAAAPSTTVIQSGNHNTSIINNGNGSVTVNR